MNNAIKEKSKSKLEIASLVLFSLNVLFYVLFLVSKFLLASGSLGLPFRLFTPTIALIGVITGAIALFTKREWIGLVLNILLIFLIFIFSWIYQLTTQ